MFYLPAVFPQFWSELVIEPLCRFYVIYDNRTFCLAYISKKLANLRFHIFRNLQQILIFAHVNSSIEVLFLYKEFGIAWHQWGGWFVPTCQELLLTATFWSLVLFFFHYFSDVFYTWSMYLLVNTYSKLSVWSSRNICVKMNKINSPFLLTIKFFMYLFWIIIVSCTTIRWFFPSYVMSKKLLVYIKLLQLWFVKRSECRLNNWKVHYDQHGSFLLCASQLPINVDTSLSFWKHPV